MSISSPSLMKRFSALIFFFLFCIFLFSPPVFAEAWHDYGQGKVRLFRVSAEHTPDKTLRSNVILGLEFQMARGWKLYWRMPGPTGFPPDIEWEDEAARAIRTEEWHWPPPQRFTLFGLESLGYEKKLLLPIDLEASRKNFTLEGKLSFLTCEKICIPITLSLSDILVSEPVADAEKLIRQAKERAPRRKNEALLNDALPGDALPGSFLPAFLTWLETPEGIGVNGFFPNHIRPARFFIAGGDEKDGLFFEEPDFMRVRDGLFFEAKGISSAEALPPSLPLELHIITNDGYFLVEQEALKQSPPALKAPLPMPAMTGISIFLIAFLGGIVINAMPCVFPVLSIKILAVLREREKLLPGISSGANAGFFLSSAGIITGFILLGLVVAGLGSGLGFAGWGFQFQSPFFLLAMAGLMGFFSLLAFGFFELSIPSRFIPFANRKWGERGGHFITGLVLPLVATSCTAPFLGTAVTFALTRGLFDILTIFSLLGLGMAFPWLLVGFNPSLMRHLPAPGPWMVWLRKILGAFLLLTMVWLLWLASLQWTPDKINPPAGQLDFQPFGLEKINDEITAEINRGQIVFVDVTAQWCLTCKTNKFFVLERKPVIGWLSDKSRVTLLQADWTKPDDRIARFLATHQRFGIPFNIIYSPTLPEGVILPPVLTERSLRTALKQAGLEGL